MYYPYPERLSALKSGKINLQDILNAFYDQIIKYKKLNAFNFIENVTGKISNTDIEISKNHFGTLSGMVFSVKDIFTQKDIPLTCSSIILSNYKAAFNSTVVSNILSNSGEIIGRTNCDEFAMGSTNETSVFGPVLNPYNQLCVAGGSSGGAAVSVAMDMCDVAIGSDTGGSVRIPASYCNVFGFKPSYGTISRNGMVCFAPLFDTVGLLSKNINLIEKSFNQLAVNDFYDATNHIPNQLTKKLPKNWKILIPSNIDNTPKPGIISKQLNDLINMDNVTSKVINLFEDAVKAYYILSVAQTASNLSRYDGIKYGFFSNSNSFEKILSNSRSIGFGEHIKKRIILGNHILFHKNELIKKAVKVKARLSKVFDELFRKYDFIILPVSATTAPHLGEVKSQTEMFHTDLYTTPANLLGLPAVSVPCGFDKNGLPAGLQILSPKYSDTQLLKFSSYFYENFLKN